MDLQKINEANLPGVLSILIMEQLPGRKWRCSTLGRPNTFLALVRETDSMLYEDATPDDIQLAHIVVESMVSAFWVLPLREAIAEALPIVVPMVDKLPHDFLHNNVLVEIMGINPEDDKAWAMRVFIAFLKADEVVRGKVVLAMLKEINKSKEVTK